MRLGLGTGSTAKHFVDLLADRVRDGLDVVCVPTSEVTREQAERLGVKLTTLDKTPELDLTVDGADEVDGRCASSRAAAARICARRSSPRHRAG